MRQVSMMRLEVDVFFIHRTLRPFFFLFYHLILSEGLSNVSCMALIDSFFSVYVYLNFPFTF